MIFAFLSLFIGGMSLLYLNSNRFKTLSCFLIGVALILISGLRSEWVGTDTQSYVQDFYSVVPGQQSIFSLFGQSEFLFYIYQNIIRRFTGSYTVFLFLPSVFYIYTVCHFINRHSFSPIISFFLFLSMGYYSFSMAGLRQTIAIGFLILATEFLLDKKFFRCILLILLASGFHVTSLIYFFVILLYFLPLNKWFLGVMALSVGLVYLGGSEFVFYLIDLVWGNKRNYKQEFGGTSTLILLVLISIAAMLFHKALWKYQKNRKTAPVPVLEGDLLFTKMLVFSIPFQFMAIYQASAFRIAMLFHFPLIALIPNVIESQEDFRIRSISKAVLIPLVLYQLFFITRWIADILPYSFFWQG